MSSESSEKGFRSADWLRVLASVCLLTWLGLSVMSAQAATTVRVIETWPSGDTVELARNQVFYLRLAYETDQPVSIWGRPYHHGEPARAGSNPSPTYHDRGEALAWFFMHEADVSVDEVRIKAGNGSRNMPIVAVWRGQVTSVNGAVEVGEKPEWVTRLRAQAKAELEKERREFEASQPETPILDILIVALVLIVLSIGLLGLGASFWLLRRWRDGWRLAALLPALLMSFVVLNIIIGVAIDPTSHNLWPFELLMSGGISLIYMLVLLLARWWTRRQRAA